MHFGRQRLCGQRVFWHRESVLCDSHPQESPQALCRHAFFFSLNIFLLPWCSFMCICLLCDSHPQESPRRLAGTHFFYFIFNPRGFSSALMFFMCITFFSESLLLGLVHHFPFFMCITFRFLCVSLSVFYVHHFPFFMCITFRFFMCITFRFFMCITIHRKTDRLLCITFRFLCVLCITFRFLCSSLSVYHFSPSPFTSSAVVCEFAREFAGLVSRGWGSCMQQN